MAKRKSSVLKIDDCFELAYPSEWAHAINGRWIEFHDSMQPGSKTQVSWREPHELEGLSDIDKCGFEAYLLSFTDEHINDRFERDDPDSTKILDDAETMTLETGEWFHCVTFIDLDDETQYFLGLLIHEPTRYLWYFQGEGPYAFIEESASLCRWIKHVALEREP